MEIKNNLDRRVPVPFTRRWFDKKHKLVNMGKLLIITFIASITSAGIGYTIGVILYGCSLITIF